MCINGNFPPGISAQVGYRLESAPASTLEETDVGTSLQHSVTGLQPQESYHFEVTASTSMGDGDTSTALVITSTNRSKLLLSLSLSQVILQYLCFN